MSLTSCPDLPAAARAIAGIIREGAAEGDANRCLAPAVVRAMVDAGLYRMTVDSRLGGYNADPITTIKTIEAVSEADGAAGWTLMIGSECAGAVSSQLDDAPGMAVFGDGQAVLAGALNPLGRFEEVEGGVRVTGQWPYASGCLHAGWFWGGGILHRDGVRRERPNGTPEFREVTVPREAFTVKDTWKVSGLRGSGSHDVVVADVFVPQEFVTSVLFQRGHATGPLTRFPFSSRLAYNKVGVALGIARAALDGFAELAGAKTPYLSGRKLRERPQAQLAMADAEATLRAGRAFCFEQVQAMWEAAAAGDEIDLRQRALLRLACSKAVEWSARAVEIVHHEAGASANFQANPLERQFRDVHVVGQHVTVSHQWYEGAGRVLLGLEPGHQSF